MKSQVPSTRGRQSLAILGVAAAYFIAAAFSFLLTALPGHMSPIFPAAGIGLAAALILGRPALLGVWLGSFTANATFQPNAHGLLHLHPKDAVILACIGLGAAVGAGAGAWLVRRFTGGEHPLHSARTLGVLLSAGTLTAAAASASGGVLTIVLAGVIPWKFAAYAWTTWFLGDAVGIILAAPLLLAWRRQGAWNVRPGAVVAAALLGGLTVLLCWLVFFHRLPFEYGLMPLLVWAAFTFGLRGTTLVALAIAVFATIGTSLGTSPFVRSTMNDSLLALHSFLGVTIVFSLLLAAVLADRRRGEGEKAELQAQLQQSQKMESLGVLAGGVAHDLNNVLGAILLQASNQAPAHEPGSAAARAFEAISLAADRGGKTIRSLLGFSRQHPVQVKDVDVNGVLLEEAGLLEHTIPAGIRLELDLAPGLGRILGDGNALAHVLLNLCVNALDAMADGGTLTLRTAADPGGVAIEVEDTGSGMTPEVRARALDPFFTTKPLGKGTGLGLAMVYATVKAHQGTLTLQSEPGQGTLVRLVFPAAEAIAEAAAPRAEPARTATVRPLKVLLVDDDAMIRESVESALDHLGHATTSAASGEEALARLEAGMRPDLIILDMNMPGLGGEQTLPRMRSLHPTVPVLLATGRVDAAALALAEADRQVTMLPKPFGLQDLRRVLGRVGSEV